MKRQTLSRLIGLSILVIVAAAAQVYPAHASAAATCDQITCPKDYFCCPLSDTTSTCLKAGDPC